MSLVLILRVFCVRRVYRGSIFFSFVLILHIPMCPRIEGDQFFTDLGFFFGARFIYKLMYNNLYNVSNFTQNRLERIHDSWAAMAAARAPPPLATSVATATAVPR